MQTRTKTRPLRADARTNRERILVAARDVFVERGPSAALDEVARRAGTGIATLYRRFPDRHALMRAVVLDALERSIEQARRAVAEESDPFQAVVRYMHGVLDVRIAAVIPALMPEISLDDEEIMRIRDEGVRIGEQMVEAAHRAGTLRPEVTFADIGLLTVRLSRPLPGPVTPEVNARLSHRHLDLVLNGLHSGERDEAAIEGPALSMGELRSMLAEADADDARPGPPVSR
jgi:AcrR family transcriptional regulator